MYDTVIDSKHVCICIYDILWLQCLGSIRSIRSKRSHFYLDASLLRFTGQWHGSHAYVWNDTSICITNNNIIISIQSLPSFKSGTTLGHRITMNILPRASIPSQCIYSGRTRSRVGVINFVANINQHSRCQYSHRCKNDNLKWVIMTPEKGL